jgi:hypothetical protein
MYATDHGFHYQYTEDELAAAAQATEESGDPAAAAGLLPDISKYLIQKTEEWGGEVRYETTMLQLIQDGSGKVTGVIAEDGNGYLQINAAKAVILATGGYEADHELLQKLNPGAYSICGFPMFTPGADGSGIKAGIWAGGQKDEIPTLMTFARAPIAPDAQFGFPYAGMTSWMGDQPFLKVNKRGERVCCETSPYDYPLHVAYHQPEGKIASIWDANYKDHIAQFHTIGCSRIMPSESTDPNGVPTGEGMGFEANDMMIGAALEAGILQQADTLEELAQKLLIEDVNAFVATVKRYNELAAKGVDEDYGKPSRDLIALDTPPYTGGYYGGHVLCTLDGLKINGDMQVMKVDQTGPIESLYAAGNCSGSMYAGTYPELFIGNAIARTITHARHAVLHILGK